jgi:hypothetical protein
VTTYSEPNVPDYSVALNLPKSYTGKDFAFDRCEDRADLLSGDVVDPNFLICRYERLFALKGSPNFYLVPWLAVPGTKSGGGWTFDENLFALSVKRSQITPAFPNSGNTVRGLKLVPSGGIHANWASQTNDTLPNVDIMGFQDTVHILIPDGQYNLAGEQIEIRDIADNKTVGKLRIIFLEKQKVEFFLIRITDTNDRFKFQRVANADIPTSLESGGAAVGYAHGKIPEDANAFGFKQIGVELSPAPDNLEIYSSGGVKLPVETTSATPLEILKSQVGLSNGTSPDLTSNKYVALCDLFLLDIEYLQAGTVKRSKYSAVFVFLTPFCVKDEKGNDATGVNIPHEIPSIEGIAAKGTVKLAIVQPHNASLFETFKCMPAEALGMKSDWIFNGRFHEFHTLVHEFAHALFVNHYFEKAEDALKASSHIVKAHKMLRLYLKNEYVPDMDSAYDDKRIKINDFMTGTVSNKPSYTYFDKINDEGMEAAVEAFIDKTFPGGPDPRPESWTSAATREMPLADLAIWISLNDLVKFNVKNGTTNVMDYELSTFERNPTPVPNTVGPQFETYVVQTPVRFSRFQWEVIRRAVRRLNELTV